MANLQVTKPVWIEDELTPRVDALAKPVWFWTRTLPVVNPKWFRDCDVVRLVRSTEAVILTRGMRMRRAVGGVRRAVRVRAGTAVVIIATSAPTQRNYRRWWQIGQRPFSYESPEEQAR